MDKNDFFRASMTSNMKRTLDGLNSGIDVNLLDDAGLFTALHYAACHDIYEKAELLIMRGADVNLKNYLGQTPLMFAEHYGHSNIVKLLLKHNAETSVPVKAEKTTSSKP